MVVAIGADKTIRRVAAVACRTTSAALERARQSRCSYGGMIDAALRRLLSLVRELLEIALPESLQVDYAYHAGIRRFYLEPQGAYSLNELRARRREAAQSHGCCRAEQTPSRMLATRQGRHPQI